jgi:hypothetical protein
VLAMRLLVKSTKGCRIQTRRRALVVAISSPPAKVRIVHLPMIAPARVFPTPTLECLAMAAQKRSQACDTSAPPVLTTTFAPPAWTHMRPKIPQDCPQKPLPVSSILVNTSSFASVELYHKDRPPPSRTEQSGFTTASPVPSARRRTSWVTATSALCAPRRTARPASRRACLSASPPLRTALLITF